MFSNNQSHTSSLLFSYLHGDFIHIFCDKIEQEEVSDLLEVVEPGFTQNIRDFVPGDSARPCLDHGCPDAGPEEHAQSVEQEHAGDGGEDDEPEPEEDVDFLVDDVEREDTQTIVALHSSRGSELVEAALCHLREDNSERVNSLLLQIHLREFDDFQAVSGEFVAEKPAITR